ncbi:TIGR01244 family sulfur transferase [Aurantiacibacter aquimixticola]|uniref:TIGR01244 family phosphatase n=1 Tax=Aurantiacibacter aquimixticola TaxID=1958945 RepID=A0A419RV61_9SPHN|nr:TIGR01244 family sulfur transferase [Aurantiacibacter aquimixticola]RJY09676.1 TIGR01244 family phosphatase [Aurantiacibacter aquimixticola]
MTDFRILSETVSASPQITTGDVAEAKAQGFAMIVNNRPDGEVPGQPAGSDIEACAAEHGLAYRAIPVGQAGFGPPQIAAMQAALAEADGKVLAYCRSGTRSTFLWALARASEGDSPETLAEAAARAGYDLNPMKDAMATLSAKARG